MKKILILLAALGLAAPAPALAQQAAVAKVLSSCGSATYPANSSQAITQDTTGAACNNATLTPAAGTVVSSAALAANLVIKNAAAKLVSFNVSADSTLSGAAWWVMIYNATSAPGDGAVTPAKCYAASSGTTSLSGAFTAPATFSTGITIGVSTTGCFTKTASTHAFISGDYE